jgi:adenylyltransferase/sulfurtransferase
LLYLAAAGVGRITLLDDDRVDVSNLQRQVLFTTDDAGEAKVVAAARRLAALNPHTVVEPREGRFNRANAHALAAAHDVVIDGSDNFATRYLVNDACVMARRPFVHGAVQGFAGQVAVFNFHRADKPPPPTYRCLFPEPPAPGEAPSCAEAGVLGVLPGIVGTLQAAEAIKIITGIGEPLSGRLLLIDALTMSTRTLQLAADPRNQNIDRLPPEDFGAACAVAAAAGDGEISAGDFRAAFAEWQLVDVREAWERVVDGGFENAVPVALEQLGSEAARVALARLDPARPTVVYCAGGARSLRALRALRGRHGFTHVKSLRGGLKALRAGRVRFEGEV